MIDWWGVLRSWLWIGGLAATLAVFSAAEYRGERERRRLRETLAEPRVQLPLLAGTTLFCLGMLIRGRGLWEQVIWGVPAVLFGVQTASVWRDERTDRVRVRPAKPRRTGTDVTTFARAKLLGWGLVAAGMLAISLWAAVVVVPTVAHSRSLRFHFRSLERIVEASASEPGMAALETAGQHLSGLQRDLEAIEARVGPVLPAGRLLGWVPRYGGDLAAAPHLLRAATGAVAAAETTFQALSPVLQASVNTDENTGASTTLEAQFLLALGEAQPALDQAQQQLEDLARARARVDASSLSPQTAALMQRLDHSLLWLQAIVDGSVLVPALLGEKGPRTYLILAQNNDELRATGGFISGVGELGIEQGRFTFVRFQDSYAVDNLGAPHELTPSDFQATLWGQLFFFRDTNWEADFRRSARRAIDVYARDQGVQADGVIALDLTALQLLVGAVGPLEVPGIAEPVTGDNVLDVIRVQWAEPFAGVDQDQGDAWWLSRKDFMGQIAGAVVDELVARRDMPTAALARALKRALEEKHILIYMADPGVAGLLRGLNWDGALPGVHSRSDLLLVADTNVGFNKVDPSVDRSIRYVVDFAAEGGPLAQVTLSYRNRSAQPVEACVQEARYERTYAEMMEGCYWDYVRVYVPMGSQLLEEPSIAPPAGSLLARRGTVLAAGSHGEDRGGLAGVGGFL